MSEFIHSLTSLNNCNIFKPPEQACIPVFRVLPIACRTIVTRLLYMDSFSSDLLAAQAQPVSLQLGFNLNILKRNQDNSLFLDKNFAASLRTVIEGRSIPVLKRVGNSAISEEQLKLDCSKKWKNLFDLISKRNKALNFRERVRQTLNGSHLLKENSGVGFQFILSSTHKQINQILRYYVIDQSSDIIKFILSLSVLDPMSLYEMPMNEQEEEILKDLQELGFVSIVGSTVQITYLLWNFLYEEPAVSIDIHCNIIVEANFRIYAYLETKDSIEEEILCNLLGLFSEIKKKFPNLIIADLTDESIRRACNKNLKARQIIQFLEMNNKKFNTQRNDKPRASEELKKRLNFLRVFQEGLSEKPLLPHNVVQQIRFWEEQRSKC